MNERLEAVARMPERERFVPRRAGTVTRDLIALDPDAAADLTTLSRLAAAVVHLGFFDREQELIECWDIVETDPAALLTIRRELTALLDDANYTEVTVDELKEAMARESLLPLRLHVDLDDYEDLLIYRRGSHHKTVEIRRLRGLRTRQRTITVESRVVVLTQVKPAQWFTERDIDPAERNLTPSQISLKQFKEVPRADIETLLPSAQVRYRPIDTLLVGLPAVVSGIAVLATKLLPTIGLIFLLVGAWLGFRDDEPELDQATLVVLIGGMITLGGFFLRQWTKLKNRRVQYLKTLSEALYFRTLADGPGVLHTLLSSAEEQEVIEILLAYRFLAAQPGGFDASQLDAAVEQWLHGACNREIDFDIEDALRKLRDLDLVRGDAHLTALPLAEALAALHGRLDTMMRDT